MTVRLPKNLNAHNTQSGAGKVLTVHTTTAYYVRKQVQFDPTRGESSFLALEEPCSFFRKNVAFHTAAAAAVTASEFYYF